MFRLLFILMLMCQFLPGAVIRLYLKDGTYQRVREYEVLEDRVKFYSVERSEWEAIPLDLIDLKRTRAEQAEVEADRKANQAALAAEDRAEREAANEVSRVPYEIGVFWVNGEQLVPLKQAESKVVTNKKRSILKAISPIPIVSGKATLELDGVTAPLTVTQERPEFYFRLALPERFGIVKLKVEKDARIVEKWSMIPVSKELLQENTPVEIFRHQVADGLYKIWPQKPIEPGEYAVIEYTEGKGNTQIWDFSYLPGKKN
ncbi:MAG: hypothetical protein FJW20_00870 [Acidimicrobiia bacterium]|nr:hypothetical protein [Acidimicrobiia bacterium]